MAVNLYINANGEMANTEPIPVLIGENEADSLADGAVPECLQNAPVGTVAYTAGCTKAWQLGTDGETWVQFIGGE